MAVVVTFTPTRLGDVNALKNTCKMTRVFQMVFGFPPLFLNPQHLRCVADAF